jgi:hypothetical protein
MQTEPLRTRVQSLNLQQLQGKIPTYYVPAQSDRANIIRLLLEDAVTFFEDQLGITSDLSFALLGPMEWQAIIDEFPYGLPWVSSPPHMIVLPATLEHPLGEMIVKMVSKHRSSFDPAQPVQQAAEDFISLVGVHEVGHIFVEQYGIDPPALWVSELLASFLAYAFLNAQYPQQVALWQGVSERFAQTIVPQFSTLADFERLYAGVGFENYLWYQGVFQLRVDEVWQACGLEFLRWLKNALAADLRPGDSDPFFLDAMEQIVPGFQIWAKQNRLV